MKFILFIIFCGFIRFCHAQKILEVNYHSLFGKPKSFQFFNNSDLDYKLKGDLFYKTQKLVNMNDSFLVFDNDSIIKLSQIKAIKIRGALISPWLFVSGVLFFLGDTGNNILNGHTTIVNEQAIIVSSALLLSGIIVKRIQDKHVYIRKHVALRVMDTDYRNLNVTK
ncbi:MAG: hypothetical protein V4565_03800 [Bacteroidota bacterium]